MAMMDDIITCLLALTVFLEHLAKLDQAAVVFVAGENENKLNWP